ncbi:MAG: phosphomannomutase/phosphoglucomutase [Deltaproteobacteria bacterium]|nr:phosphomannomutase/phosphoglucomutase [Deltaproteobacteria bacterium]
MQIPTHVFREYDIRGVADVDLGDELVTAIGRALATELREVGSTPPEATIRVAVARDCRLSSPRLFAALTRGLMESGADVIELGVGPTPLLYFAAHHLRTDGAVMITGSHNPAEDNGFKMMRGTGALYGDAVRGLRDRIERGAFATGPLGTLTSEDVSDAYVEAVVARSRFERTPSDLKVVLDAGNGAAGPLSLRVFEALGLRVDPMFCEMDGTFPNHHPDPTVEENLEALRARVLATGAQLGIAFDGDGDRVGVIDEAGGVVWGDKLMVLFSRGVLAEHPGAAILGEVKCSQTLFDDIAKHGGRPIVSRTGHSLIKKRMKEEGALLAGEMSGHIFFADRYFGFDDAIYGAVRVLEIVAQTGKSPRELLADVPRTAATPELRVSCPDRIKFEVVARVLEHYRRTHDVIDVDGARILFGDGAWGLCRASNTGAILVLRFEARTDERLHTIRAEVEAVVSKAVSELAN